MSLPKYVLRTSFSCSGPVTPCPVDTCCDNATTTSSSDVTGLHIGTAGSQRVYVDKVSNKLRFKGVMEDGGITITDDGFNLKFKVETAVVPPIEFTLTGDDSYTLVAGDFILYILVKPTVAQILAFSVGLTNNGQELITDTPLMVIDGWVRFPLGWLIEAPNVDLFFNGITSSADIIIILA